MTCLLHTVELLSSGILGAQEHWTRELLFKKTPNPFPWSRVSYWHDCAQRIKLRIRASFFFPPIAEFWRIIRWNASLVHDHNLYRWVLTFIPHNYIHFLSSSLQLLNNSCCKTNIWIMSQDLKGLKKSGAFYSPYTTMICQRLRIVFITEQGILARRRFSQSDTVSKRKASTLNRILLCTFEFSDF